MKIKNLMIWLLVGSTASLSVNALEFKKGLKNPDKIYYESEADTLFISNIEGNAATKDGYASLVRMKLVTDDKAKVGIEDGWLLRNQGRADKLDSPRGMARIDKYLVIADVDQLRFFAYDPATMKLRFVHNLKVNGAKNISDIKVIDGKILIADEQAGGILVLQNYADEKKRKVSLLLKNIPGIRDMYVDAETKKLFFVSSMQNFLFEYNLTTKEKKKHALVLDGNLTGLSSLTRGSEGEFYLANKVTGKIYVFKLGNKAVPQQWSQGLQWPTGIEYLADRNVLAVVESKSNKVTFLAALKREPKKKAE